MPASPQTTSLGWSMTGLDASIFASGHRTAHALLRKAAALEERLVHMQTSPRRADCQVS